MNQYGEVFSKIYDRHFGGYADQLAPRLLRFLASQAAGVDGGRVLDLGCGTGQLAFRLLEAGYSLTGLDRSQDMLDIAETRCRKHLLTGRARFQRADISSFRVEPPQDFAISTYNTMNHLEEDGRLRGCFRSVREVLVPGGHLFFDYHTVLGLREWASRESVEWDEGGVTVEGSFDEGRGFARMSISGSSAGVAFKEEITNQSYPVHEIGKWLREEGFDEVRILDLADFSPCPDPEHESRVGIHAR